MSFSPILIVNGEPNSIFLEIFFKSLSRLKIKSPIILIASEKIVKLQMRKFKFKKKINILNPKNIKVEKLKNDNINLIDVKFKSQKKIFDKISNKSNKYIDKSFEVAFEIIKKNNFKKFINGPINKRTYLNKKFLGITEFIGSKFNLQKSAMLIYNKKLSVCPLTTHLPLKKVSKIVTKEAIEEKIELIHNFYKNKLKIKPKIAVLGLNPHCESIDKFNEDEEIIKPTIKFLKKKYEIYGPFSADTMFLSQNRKKYDVILGMYHDQVLTPIKTLFEYDAINITLGLPFLRISPDHGPNEKMMGKNISDPLSLIQAIKFLDKN